MRVTLIGHSCLRVRTRAGTILIDPWLSGSCFWRSWWHFPPTQEPDAEMLAPDYVYLTHHHFDHFHYPSMRRLDRAAKILIPRFGVDVMPAEVTSLGFAPPREDDHVVVDVNDCKIRGRALAQVTADFGRPTIACKSHSFAQSYPALYTSDDPAQLRFVSRETYLDDFHDVMTDIRPKYAFPFGSMVGFLHPDTRALNDHLVTPAAVVEGVAARGGIEGTEVVTMAPGDSWDSDDGFDRSDFDWYADRERHLEELTEKNQPKLDAQAASEEGRTVDWAAFEAHFGQMVREVPRLLGRRLAPRRFVFHVPSDAATPYWWVSFRTRSVGRSATLPDDRSGLTIVPEPVLADAIRDRIVQLVHGSMRIRTELAPGGVESDLGFWGVLMVWELGYLPLRDEINKAPSQSWPSIAPRWRVRQSIVKASVPQIFNQVSR